ncbi:hypothetical protein [Puniceibacterium sediminis]|uniref:Uncharacterized protein n=1 Tax=Puniceibacterium sediminis TaxID=1608407 RepID=A0A238ZXK4_9RHOB|nr:hypothetical protein [Puniceibacterium sediminis]SNR88166.1 hypothetical protein SAMN06265370_1493 [Puniceibacterium sediminis]
MAVERDENTDHNSLRLCYRGFSAEAKGIGAVLIVSLLVAIPIATKLWY